jgi:dTDP-4-amino-4,6-dideoxygalactose transaminase
MKNIYVTKPSLPDLAEFTKLLEEVWNSKQLTNDGPMHRRLETAVADHLGVTHMSLFNNGTIALLGALRALQLTGEVITTPFSFVATTHALAWNNLDPVFVDIEPETYNIDPAAIEAAITDRTSAILPVHCYGRPCDVAAIQKIADRHGLKVIYDAAHAFGVRDEGGSILRHGDLSVLSFHATKVFTTLEGGAIVAPDQRIKGRIDRLKNFGIVSQTAVEGIGFNGKMNEVQAAFGLLQLKDIEDALEARARVAQRYREALAQVAGLTLPQGQEPAVYNNAYFPILVGEEFPLSRDKLFEKMEAAGIFPRRYFYPLISNISAYADLPSAQRDRLPVANRVAEQVLCLPIYPDLATDDIERIIDILTGV